MTRGCGLGFVFVVLAAYLSPAFGNEDSPLDLETIVITKSNIHLANPYSLEPNPLSSSPIEALTFTPLDLQGRALKADIQTDFSLRGSNFQGVLLLIDGQRVNDPQTGHHNSDIPLTREDIQRIEVIPGLSSSLFGPDAIGGAINFIIKRPQAKRMTLESSFGSHQTKSNIFSITEQRDNLGIRLSLENQESAGFRYDTEFKKFTTTLTSSVDIPYGEFDVVLGYQEKEFGAYDFYTPAKDYASQEWTKTHFLNAGFILDGKTFIIKPNFLWRRHYDKFMLDKTQLRSTYLNHHRTDVYTPNIYFQKEGEILGRVGLGLEYGQEHINSTNLGKHSRGHKSVYMDNSKIIIPGLSLGLSFRVDDYQGFDQAYSGSSKFRYTITEEGSIFFGLSRSIRIPNFTELYYNDPTTIGNSGLSEERSLNFEAGFDYKKDKFSSGITSFLRKEEDFIDWIKRYPAQSKWRAENVAEAEVFGIESYLRLKIDQNFFLDSNYAYVNKRIDEGGYLYKYGPNYIRHIFNAVFNFNLPFGTQILGLTYKKKPNRNGWLLLNTYFSYNINQNSQVFLRITNLLNVEYQEIESIPQPGRWIESGLKFEW